MIKAAADGERRNIANFIEFTTLQYITSSQYISNLEFQEILDDADLVKSLKKGLEEAKNGEYDLV